MIKLYNFGSGQVINTEEEFLPPHCLFIAKVDKKFYKIAATGTDDEYLLERYEEISKMHFYQLYTKSHIILRDGELIVENKDLLSLKGVVKGNEKYYLNNFLYDFDKKEELLEKLTEEKGYIMPPLQVILHKNEEQS